MTFIGDQNEFHCYIHYTRGLGPPQIEAGVRAIKVEAPNYYRKMNVEELIDWT